MIMTKIYAVYIMTNQPKGTLYTGVTSDLVKRVYQHKNAIFQGFTDRCDRARKANQSRLKKKED